LEYPVPATAPLIVMPSPRIVLPEEVRIIQPVPLGSSNSSGWSDFDFISEYTSWADVVEIPREIHTAVAVQLVASMLNHNAVSIRHGDFTYPLDLWLLLLTESGGGRSAIIRGVKRLLRAAGFRDRIKDSDWGSEPAMIQHFAENPYSLFFWSEFSERLDFFNKQGGKRWFTDRYDDTELPDSRTYRKANPLTNTPPINFPHAPRINIIAASSDGWFFQNMETEDSTGGFLPRWMLIRTGKMIDVPTPPELDEKVQSELVNRLKYIATIRGKADISQILPRFNEEWYTPTRERFESASSNLGRTYFSRHRNLVLKLAVIYEASRSGSLKVSDDAWDRAVATARVLETTLFELLKTNMNQRGWEISKLEDFIRSGGAKGVTRNEITRAFRNLEDLEKHLTTLLNGDDVRKAIRRTPGRSATVYVHREFFDQILP
jgi:hypothetical protein